MDEIINLNDGEFGTYTVESLNSITKSKRTKWNCICKCGRKKVLYGDTLMSGVGLPVCLCKLNKKPNNTTLSAYKEIMRNRNEVCKAWKNGYDMFLRNMGERPSWRHKLIRVDENEPYSKDNCEWRSPSPLIEYKGKTRTLNEVSIELEIPYHILYARIKRGDKNPFEPTEKKRIGNRKKILKCNLKGKVLKTYSSIKEASDDTGLSKSKIKSCLEGKLRALSCFSWRYDTNIPKDDLIGLNVP